MFSFLCFRANINSSSEHEPLQPPHQEELQRRTASTARGSFFGDDELCICREAWVDIEKTTRPRSFSIKRHMPRALSYHPTQGFHPYLLRIPTLCLGLTATQTRPGWCTCIPIVTSSHPSTTHALYQILVSKVQILWSTRMGPYFGVQTSTQKVQ